MTASKFIARAASVLALAILILGWALIITIQPSMFVVPLFVTALVYWPDKKRIWWWITCRCYRHHGMHDAFYAQGFACLWCGAKPT